MSNQPCNPYERVEYLGNAITTRGALNTKGAWVQAIASTGFDYTSLTVSLRCDASSGGGACYLLDVGIGGAGSEVVLLPNLLLDGKRSYNGAIRTLTLPVNIAAGSRIAVREQDDVSGGTRNAQINMCGRSGGINKVLSFSGKYFDYGTIPASSNATIIDPGAVANTWGAWTELTASTSADHNVLAILLGCNSLTSNASATDAEYQIAVGAAGSEQIIGGGSLNIDPTNYVTPAGVFYANIPAGSRISARSISGSTSTVNRSLTMAVYGG